MQVEKICPLMSDAENEVDCVEKKCGLFDQNFEMCSIRVIADWLVEMPNAE